MDGARLVTWYKIEVGCQFGKGDLTMLGGRVMSIASTTIISSHSNLINSVLVKLSLHFVEIDKRPSYVLPALDVDQGNIFV